MKKASLLLKLASVLLVAAMLLTAFSVNAADVNGYYKSIASLDFEQVNTNLPKYDYTTVTTICNGSTGYLYANPNSINNITIVPIQGLQKDAKYTYMVDFYVLEYSNDANGIFARLDLANMEGQLIETYLNKNTYRLNEWNTYSKQVTYNTTLDSWINIFSFAEAKIIFDNVRIVDENGNVVFCEDFETEDLTLVDGFSYIHDYSGSSVDADDKALNISNNTANVVNCTIGGFAFGEESARTEYIVTYDYLITKKSINDANAFAFRFGSYCAECKGAMAEHQAKGDVSHYLGNGKETNKWYKDTLSVYMEDKCDNVYFQVYTYAGAEFLLDNIVVKKADGTVVANYNMDAGTVPGNITNGSFAGEYSFPVKNEVIWLKGTPNAADGHISVDTTDLIAEYKAIDIEFTSSQAITANRYPNVSFDYKMSGVPNTANGVVVAISFNGVTDPAYSRNFFKPSDTNGEWVTADAITYTNLDVREGVNTLNLLVYGGVEIEIDNIKLENSGTIAANIDFAGNGTFTEESDTRVAVTDTAMFIDTTSIADNNTANEQFWFNNMGMSNYYNQLVSGEKYTITFDVYPTKKPENSTGFFHYRTSSGSNAVMAGWWGGNLELNKWQTTSNTFTVDDASKTGNHVLYVYGGFKGYIDNVRLLDKNGNVVDKTYTDLEGLTIPSNYASYLTLTTDAPAKTAGGNFVGDNYEVKYVVDNEGIKTYGSNGVLIVNPAENTYYGINKKHFGFEFENGKKYRLTFDYDITVPAPGGYYFAVTNVKGSGNHDFINTEDALSATQTYEFTYAGSLDFVIYGGGEVIFDNFLLEEFVSYPTLGVQKREADEDGKVAALAYGMQLHSVGGAEYIYTANGDAVAVEEKGFIAVLSNRVDGELTLDLENPYVQVIEVTNAAESVIFGGEIHNVYTLAVTEPEADRSISVRSYVIGADGNVYYGDAVVAAANDLANEEFNAWIGAKVAG